MSSNRGRVSSWLGFLALSMAGILSRLPQLNYNQYPFAQCDENIYLSESSRMVTENTIIFNEFRGGGVNFLPTVLSVILGLDLDSASLQLLGRVLLTVVIGGLAPGLAFLLAQQLTRSLFISWFVGLSTLFSPLLLINSVYWYPDSYIASFALLAVWLTIRVLDDESIAAKKLVVLGVVCGLGLSVKLTFLSVVAVILYLIWRRDRENFLVPIRKSNFFWIASAAAATWLVLNWPALVTPFDFIRNNGGNVVVYQGGTRSVEGLLFYALSAGPMSLGTLQSLVVVSGVLLAFKKRDRVGIAVSIALFAGIAVFGLQSQWLHRNMSTFIVFGVVLLALGMSLLWRELEGSGRFVRVSLSAVAASYLALTSLIFSYSFQARVDSQLDAQTLHAEVTAFVLSSNPKALEPSEPGCQLSIYEEAKRLGWKPNVGGRTLEIEFTNAPRKDFISDAALRLIPDKNLIHLTTDLYRPTAETSWISSMFSEPKEVKSLIAKFSDGFFEYRVLEVKP